jgi:hypothetical protein
MKSCDEECARKGIPDHLHQLERGVDLDFPDDELLFRRFRFSNADLTSAIKFNEMSVNRAKYCKDPDDVLWDDGYPTAVVRLSLETGRRSPSTRS